MSEIKRFLQIPPGYGEGFDENFYFSSILNDNHSLDDNLKDDKIYENYIRVPFLHENMIKTKFSTCKSSSDISPLQSTTCEPTPRSFQKWGWLAAEFNEDDKSEEIGHTPVAKKAKKILQMVDKPKNVGVQPIDGDDLDIYSNVLATNEFSFLDSNGKYVKSRPPPTYIEYYEYEESIKKAAYHPMKDLKEREDLKRIECINEETNNNNRGLKAYAIKQAAK